MSVSMSRAEREAFLAEVHVGVLTVAVGDGGGPLATPVWYSYQPGGQVSITTGGNSKKARAIAAAGRFSMCAQHEAPPYKYVTVEGPAVIEPAEMGFSGRSLSPSSTWTRSGGRPSASAAICVITV